MNNDTQVQVLEALRKLPLEAAMGEVHLVRLAAVGTMEAFRAGKTLFEEGGPAIALRIVVQGRVSLLIGQPDNEAAVVGTAGRGDLLGWAALRPGARWQTTARAAKSGHCLKFPADALRDLCASDHELGYHIMRHAYLDLAQRHADLRVQLLDMYGQR